MMEMRGSQKWSLRFAIIRRGPRLEVCATELLDAHNLNLMATCIQNSTVKYVLNISNITSILSYIPASPY
jgi:hypothetical protein